MKIIFYLSRRPILSRKVQNHKRPYHTLSKLAHNTYTLFYTKISFQVFEYFNSLISTFKIYVIYSSPVLEPGEKKIYIFIGKPQKNLFS